MMSGSADRRQHMMLWRRAILAASLALTLVLVMHLNSEGGHEFERENTIIGGDNRCHHRHHHLDLLYRSSQCSHGVA